MLATTIIGVTLSWIWWMMILFFWILIAFWPAMMAKRKGYNFWLFLLMSLFFWWITFFVVLFLEDKSGTGGTPTAPAV